MEKESVKRKKPPIFKRGGFYLVENST